MDVKDLKANTGNIDLVLDIIEKGEVREFNKFGKPGRVCSCKCKDETGQVTLTLWNEQIDAVKEGDKVHLTNGWCSEFQGQLQVSSGKFGKLEVVGSAQPSENPAPEPKEEPEEEFTVEEETLE